MLLATALRGRPVSRPTVDERPDAMQLAVSPLAVLVMINAVGVAMLFAVAAFVPNVAQTLVLLGMVTFLIGLNLATMILSTRIAERFTVAVLAVIAEVMILLMAALGAAFVLDALVELGALTLD